MERAADIYTLWLRARLVGRTWRSGRTSPRRALQACRPLGARLDARLGAAWLLAPAPELLSRGVLVQAEVQARLPHGLRGDLLYEWLDPGAFHDGRYGLPALTDPVSFFRWQLDWTF
ncbi:MAG: hypothetical protein R3D98_11940 [Candidatus Krumholzibacteriia bacterium]